MMPCSTGLMYSFGMLPPTTLFSTTTPLPFSPGSIADDRVAVLAAPARLTDELALAFRRLRDRLAVGDLRLARDRLHVELAEHPVLDDVQMQLAHAGDDRLTRFLVRCHAERRVFLGEPLQRHRHLVAVGLAVRLDRHRDDRLGERDRFEQDRMLFVANRVAGGDVLQADQRADVAGVTNINVLAVIGVHLQQAADALAFVVARVVDRRAFRDPPGIDPEENQFADVRITPNLERQRAERAVVVGPPLRGAFRVGIHAHDIRHIQRRRQIIHHCVKQRLHTLVLERRAADDRHELVLQHKTANTGPQLLGTDRLAIEELVHQFLVLFRHRLDEFRVRRLRRPPPCRRESRSRRTSRRVPRQSKRWPASQRGPRRP